MLDNAVAALQEIRSGILFCSHEHTIDLGIVVRLISANGFILIDQKEAPGNIIHIAGHGDGLYDRHGYWLIGGICKLVTSAGSSSTGTIRPFGLDCSGFTDWVYKTALGVSIQAGSWGQYTHSSPISESELLPGDLGFLMNAQGTTSHVLIFAGYTESGTRQWVHSESGTGVHVSTPRYDSELVLRRPNNVDFSQDVGSSAYGDPLYSLTVDVTHYCACTRCCGPNAQGITASGKRVTEGMVAMSSHYPFGTQIMINGVMYTVEDRGGSGIENDISRVDIYVSDHNYALRLGRFKTTAYIYRLGR